MELQMSGSCRFVEIALPAPAALLTFEQPAGCTEQEAHAGVRVTLLPSHNLVSLASLQHDETQTSVC